MWGYIKREECAGGKIWLSEEWIAGVRFAVLHCGIINTPWRQYRLVRKLHRMREWGVRQSIVPHEWETLCLREGIHPVSEAPLRQTLMEPLWDRFCRQNGLQIQGCTVCLQGSRRNPVTEQAAVLLSRKARYLVLELEDGQEQMSNWLRREYGLSVWRGGQQVAAKICCGKAMAQDMPTLWLGQDCEKYQQVTYSLNGVWRGEVEENPQLLTVLLTEGKLTPEDIEIKSVESHA